VKYRHAILIVLLVIVCDQALKFYVNTHFTYEEQVNVIGHWFKLLFIENEGMAFGMKLSQADVGKLILTLFRLVAVIFGFYLLKRIVDKKYSNGVIICGSLILAGALGNLIDSMFYGLIFTQSYEQYHWVSGGTPPASLVSWGHGYGKFLHGQVVDMLYFPIVDTRLPHWVPVIGGNSIVFFEPVFNIADAAISVGVLTLVFFQKRLIHKRVAVKQPITQ
jgi:signal peptidase II